MKSTELIDALDVLAEAPDGIARLRELVLQLAVCGKLVAQNPEDEPAAALIERVAEAKRSVAKGGKARKARPTEPVTEEEVPFPVPTGWVWARIEEVSPLVTDGVHKTPKYVNSGVPFLSIKDISGGKLDFSDTKYVTQEEHEAINTRCNPERGDILFCRIGTLGRAVVVNTDRPFSLFVSVGLIKLTKDIDSAFLRIALNSPDAYQQYQRIKAGGSHADKLNLGAMRSAIVPIPPFSEQHRIVARVHELMALLDQLEASRNAREATRVALRDSALAALRDADRPEEVDVAWGRLAEHMDDLFTDPADVAPLRQTVLQLAVRGRLVPRDPTDEPASALLERIAEERAGLVNGKTNADSASVAGGETQFELPTGWAWTRVQELSIAVTSGSRGWKKYYAPRGASFIRSQDIKWDRLHYDNRVFVAIPKGVEGTRTRVKQGDWLVTITGANVGKCAHLVEPIDEAYVSQHVALIRPIGDEIGRFVHLWLIAEHGGRGLLVGDQYGAKPGLNLRQIRELPVPMPPLAEQHRIVAKVDELTTKLDELKQHLATKTAAHDAFAAAAVHHLDA